LEEKEQDIEGGEGRGAEAVELFTLYAGGHLCQFNVVCMYEVKSI